MGQQRVIQGTVVSDKMDKTVVVTVERRKKHRLYHKVVSFTVRFKAHDEANECKLGDLVRIEESRPISRDKRWRVIEILSRGDVAEVAPATIGRELEATTQVAPKREDEVAAEAAEDGTEKEEEEVTA
jgi:small subunit ribosomal protein S17